MPKDLWLVVKTHPAETNFSSYNKIRAFAQKRRILFLEERSVKELIEKSKAVVTINSTVGIESLLFSKPVVVLGNAFYAGRGFTFDVKELGQFSHMLEEALVSRVDEKKIKEFLYTLRYHYLISGDYRDPKRYPLTPIINLIAGKI